MRSLTLALALAIPCCPLSASTRLQRSPATTAPTYKPLHNVTLINMSGKRRQALFGDLRLDLPEGKPFVMKLHIGDTLQIVSDIDSRLDERLLISEADTTRFIPVP